MTQDDWEFTLNAVTVDATQAVLDANEFNDAPADGNQFLLANVTVKYIGNDPEGSTPFTSVAFVTSSGNTVNTYDSFVMAPEPFPTLETLYEGASATGNEAFEIPTDGAAEGSLAVTVTMFGDKLFFAVK